MTSKNSNFGIRRPQIITVTVIALTALYINKPEVVINEEGSLNSKFLFKYSSAGGFGAIPGLSKMISYDSNTNELICKDVERDINSVTQISEVQEPQLRDEIIRINNTLKTIEDPGECRDCIRHTFSFAVEDKRPYIVSLNEAPSNNVRNFIDNIISTICKR